MTGSGSAIGAGVATEIGSTTGSGSAMGGAGLATRRDRILRLIPSVSRTRELSNRVS